MEGGAHDSGSFREGLKGRVYQTGLHYVVEIVKQYPSHAGVTALCTELGASAVPV